MGNQRLFTRLPIPLGAELFLESGILKGTVQDISMGGCRMQCDSDLDLDLEGAINLFYPDHRQEMQIEASVRVTRCDANEIALEFTGVAMECYHHLRHLLMNNAVDNIESELESQAGIKERR